MLVTTVFYCVDYLGKTALRLRWDGKPFPKEYKPTTDTNTYNRIVSVYTLVIC